MVLGRIGTRRVTAEELEAVKVAEAAAAPKAPPPPKPHELQVASKLKAQHRLDSAQLARTLAFAQQRGVSEGEALIALGFAQEDDVIAAEAELTAGRWVSHAQLAESDAADAREKLSAATCIEWQVLPIELRGNALTLAMRDPLCPASYAKLSELVPGLKLVTVRAGARALQHAIDLHHASINADDPSTWIER